MPNYKHSDIEDGQGLFLVVNLKEQLLPGTFEHMLNEIINTKIDLKEFDLNYRNDHAGKRHTAWGAVETDTLRV